jgi:hypothetical protein
MSQRMPGLKLEINRTETEFNSLNKYAFSLFSAFTAYMNIIYLCKLLRNKCSYAADIKKCNCNLILYRT